MNEAQLAASMLLSPSDFHFLHQDQSKGAHGLLSIGSEIRDADAIDQV
jgi:hypothetical protein